MSLSQTGVHRNKNTYSIKNKLCPEYSTIETLINIPIK